MLAKLLLPLLAAASAAVSVLTNNVDIVSVHTTSVDTMGTHIGHLDGRDELVCQTDFQPVDANYPRGHVIQRCQQNIQFLKDSDTLHVRVGHCWSFSDLDVCTLWVCNTGVEAISFYTEPLADLITDQILEKCLISNWWGHYDLANYTVSLEPFGFLAVPYVPDPDPEHFELEHPHTSTSEVVRRDASEQGLHCQIHQERINATFNHDLVVRTCQNNIEYIKAQEAILLESLACWMVVTEMCATKVCNSNPTDDIYFNSSLLANVATKEVLNKCIAGNWWGTWNAPDYSVSMEPHQPASPPASSELKHSETSKQVGATKAHIEVCPNSFPQDRD